MGGKSMLSKTYVQACLDGDANIFDLVTTLIIGMIMTQV